MEEQYYKWGFKMKKEINNHSSQIKIILEVVKNSVMLDLGAFII